MASTGRLVTRRFFFRIALSAALLLCAGAAVAWYFLRGSVPQQPPPSSSTGNVDPRVAYQGPFRNVHPDVATVGSAKCAECHADIAQKYSRHPMGMSIVPVSNQPIGELADKAHVSFDALGSRFRIDRAGNRLWYTETRMGQNGSPLFEMTADIQYVIGSGSKGHSFLCERDGFIAQAPVSWFAQKRVWDESQGFPRDLHAGRPIQVGCLYCHANEVSPVSGTQNRYQQPIFRGGAAIGCERCHGPGAEHVRMRESGESPGGIDYSIVNPRHLEPALRESVCQQCHLAGEIRVVRSGRSLSDFRPGLPLDSVIRVLVQDHQGEDRKAVNHVEQMYLSKCYTASGGKLGCITCHDPHEKAAPEKRVEQFRTACLKCHDCSTPLAARTANGANNNCAACHMPRFAAGDIAHAATTDHRIVRPSAATKAGGMPQPAITRPLVFFPSRVPDFQNSAEGRDFAVGLVQLATQGRLPPGKSAGDALPLLERAIANDPDDYRAWESKSYALQFVGRKSEALAAAQTVVTLSPDYESGLSHAAALAFEEGRVDLSLQYWRKAVALNPGNASHHEELATVLAKSGDWTAARAEAEAAIRLDPARATARTVLAMALVRAGDKAKGDGMFQSVEALNPSNLSDLRRRYAAERSRP